MMDSATNSQMMVMKLSFPNITPVLILSVMVLASALSAAPVVHPFESGGGFEPGNGVDVAVLADLRRRGLEPANRCSDEVFVRRVFLDLTGTLPDHREVEGFLANSDPRKRIKLVEGLFLRPEFADYWAMKWCDLLRVKAEFPVKLWPNAVQAYHRWLRDAVVDNMPYDQFAKELLTSSGSNFRFPQVNFMRGAQGESPSAIAKVVALTFMGTRFEKWPEARRSGMAAFFSRLSFKGTAEWKEQIVMMNPAPAGPLSATFPDGRRVVIPADRDPRSVFTRWLTEKNNPWFARAMANRVWSWFFGRGVIHEPDDIGPDNPPVNADLLIFLETEFIESGYDIRHLFRLVVHSATYQQSSIPKGDPELSERCFACYPPRQLEAETLLDALCDITGTQEEYMSMIPEPFSYVPADNRSVSLADGSVTSQFLEMFGRPSRDTGAESERDGHSTKAQRLHMLNSSHVRKKLRSGWRLRKLAKSAKGDRLKAVDLVYLSVLSRHPTAAELLTLKDYAKDINRSHVSEDLVWALINSKEFIFKH